MERRTMNTKWQFNKEISLVDIIAIIGSFTSILYAYTTLDKRQTVTEDRVATQITRDAIQDQTLIRYQQETSQALQTMNQKLDRIIELRIK